jgi:NAD/NADP transhydrogenase alpha subunit
MAAHSHRFAVLHSSRRHSLKARAYRAATSPAAKGAYIAVGVAGLAALGIAIFGPRRFRRVVVDPVRDAVSDQAERLWSEAQPLRAELAELIRRTASQSGRENFVRNFQSWIGHFRAD